jgi:hypothetical protein
MEKRSDIITKMQFPRGKSFIVLVALAALFAMPADAALKDQVGQAFQAVYSRAPTASEKTYWTSRVTSGDKKTYDALVGAMGYAKARGSTGVAAPKPAAAKPVAVSAAAKQQLIKDVLPVFIQIYGNNPSEAEKAWWRKRISCGEIKNEAQLRSSMGFHKAKKVRKGSDAICGGVASSEAAPSGVARKEVAGVSTHPLGDDVRIGIFKTTGSAIQVTANGKFQIREGRNRIIGTVDEGTVISVSWSGGKYHIRGEGIEEDVDQEVRLVPVGGAIMQIKNYSDPSKTIPGKNYNRFRGVIEVRKCDGCNELWAINELRTEYYLRGLAETSGEGPEEYLKALGAAARTYVLYHKIVTGGRFPKQGFDIGNTPNDQIYRGYEFETITPRFSSVLNKVKGVVVTDGEGDKLVATVYFSDSDGRTRSAKEAWNSSRFPHLQSVDDPHHAAKSCVGHCVGMSAQGAYGLANKDSWSFSKILGYFYKGVRIIKAY